MVYLLEHEFGFATDAIGYPSIDACRAILYQNGNGLFGYHNLGGSKPEQWPARAEQFAEYVTSHPQGAGTGLNLFVVTFVTNKGGYSLTSLRDWKGEAAAFADKLGFRGSRFGFNLSALYTSTSAYVEIRRTAGTCAVYTQAWNDGDVTGTTPYVEGDNHKMNPKSPFAKMSNKADFITGMNTAMLKQRNYETLL